MTSHMEENHINEDYDGEGNSSEDDELDVLSYHDVDDTEDDKPEGSKNVTENIGHSITSLGHLRHSYIVKSRKSRRNVFTRCIYKCSVLKRRKQQYSSNQQDTVGFYRSWFISKNVPIQVSIVNMSDTRGLLIPPPKSRRSSTATTSSLLSLEGDPPRLVQQVYKAFESHRSSTSEDAKAPLKKSHPTHWFKRKSPTKVLPKYVQSEQLQSNTELKPQENIGEYSECESPPKSPPPRRSLVLRLNSIGHQDEYTNVPALTTEHSHRFTLHPYLYVIKVRHGDFEWIIRKRYKHFASLRQHIVLQKARLKLHLPGRDSSLDRKNLNAEDVASVRHDFPVRAQSTTGEHRRRSHGSTLLPHFPRGDIFMRSEDIEGKKRSLEAYLQAAVNISLIRNNSELCEFLEVSPASFIPSLGRKMKEGFVMKKSQYCGTPTSWWTGRRVMGPSYKRWLFLKETCLGYFRPGKWELAQVILFDEHFSVKCGRLATGVKNGLLVTNSTKSLLFKCSSERQMSEWFVAIRNAKATCAKMFCQQKRFESFAPMRENTPIQWHVDGFNYFNALLAALETAKEQIFISDWWLTPEIHMARPSAEKTTRIDHVLCKKAGEGVLVYVMLYKELTVTLSINSAYTKKTLSGLHPNIRVIRHPDHMKDRIFLWSHHEKLAVIDQNIAFLGGLDICFGRWDTTEHFLVDYGSNHWVPNEKTLGIQFEPPVWPVDEEKEAPNIAETPGPAGEEIERPIDKWRRKVRRICEDIRAQNLSAQEDYNVHHPTMTKKPFYSRQAPKFVLQQGSMHNVMEQLWVNAPDTFGETKDGQLFVKAKTPKMANIVDAVLERRKEEEFQRDTEERKPEEHPENRNSTIHRVAARFKAIFGEDSEEQENGEETPETSLASPPEAQLVSEQAPVKRASGCCGCSMQAASNKHGESTIWIGKDYANWLLKDVTNVEFPHVDIVDRAKVPRTPWHDVGVCIYGRAARDVAKHFIQRWNVLKATKYYKRSEIPYLILKSYAACSGLSEYRRQRRRASQGKDGVPPPVVFTTRVQILRSCGPWSAGLDHTEASIHAAYCAVISNAESFVLIENQFFISVCVDDVNASEGVENKVAKAIMERVLWAHSQQREFRVFILVPLLTAFAGKIGRNTAMFTKIVLHYMRNSICRHPSSMFEQLKARGVERPEDYISICSLRNHGNIGDRPVTEIVYIHSKTLVVDDRVVIVGSANINDRSMLGNRDSEVAMISEDSGSELREGRLGGRRTQIGRFASSLRVALMREYLGVPVEHRAIMGTGAQSRKDAPSPMTTEEGGNVVSMEWDYDLLADPCSPQFYLGVWKRIADNNTAIYERVFLASPSDNERSYTDLEQRREIRPLPEKDPDAAKKELDAVRGYLVQYPLHFLEQENLLPRFSNPRGHLPDRMWL